MDIESAYFVSNLFDFTTSSIGSKRLRDRGRRESGF